MPSEAHASVRARAQADDEEAIVALLLAQVVRAYPAIDHPGALAAVREGFRRMPTAARRALIHELGADVEPSPDTPADAPARPVTAGGT